MTEKQREKLYLSMENAEIYCSSFGTYVNDVPLAKILYKIYGDEAFQGRITISVYPNNPTNEIQVGSKSCRDMGTLEDFVKEGSNEQKATETDPES